MLNSFNGILQQEFAHSEDRQLRGLTLIGQGDRRHKPNQTQYAPRSQLEAPESRRGFSCQVPNAIAAAIKNSIRGSREARIIVFTH